MDEKTYNAAIKNLKRKLISRDKQEDRLWEHEQDRWGDMTTEQLEALLREITGTQKLRNFIEAADRFDQKTLAEDARKKLSIVEGAVLFY